jgi:protein-tyrosine phosphatase
VSLIRAAVHAIVQSLRARRGVVVHCWGGRGRTGTVLGCALRELGHDGEAVVAYLNRVHVARGEEGWPESSWQGDLVRRWPDVYYSEHEILDI